MTQKTDIKQTNTERATGKDEALQHIVIHTNGEIEKQAHGSKEEECLWLLTGVSWRAPWSDIRQLHVGFYYIPVSKRHGKTRNNKPGRREVRAYGSSKRGKRSKENKEHPLEEVLNNVNKRMLRKR